MMVQQSKKKKTFIIVSLLIIIVGIITFVLAYGLSDGWQAVAEWFVSKYAVMLYIILGCYSLLVLWLIISDRIKKL